jgi:osmotically inducible lipoprotein OsmB
MKTRRMVLAFCLVGSLAGCSNMSTSDKHLATGAAIGTASGALIAGLTKGNPWTGALIGAAVGTAGGYLYNQHEKSEGN